MIDKEIEISARIAVANQLCAMLYNNVIDNAEMSVTSESFEGWCADGEVFGEEDDAIAGRAMEIVREFGGKLDNILWDMVALDDIAKD